MTSPCLFPFLETWGNGRGLLRGLNIHTYKKPQTEPGTQQAHNKCQLLSGLTTVLPALTTRPLPELLLSGDVGVVDILMLCSMVSLPALDQKGPQGSAAT